MLRDRILQRRSPLAAASAAGGQFGLRTAAMRRVRRVSIAAAQPELAAADSVSADLPALARPAATIRRVAAALRRSRTAHAAVPVGSAAAVPRIRLCKLGGATLSRARARNTAGDTIASCAADSRAAAVCAAAAAAAHTPRGGASRNAAASRCAGTPAAAAAVPSPNIGAARAAAASLSRLTAPNLADRP